MSPAGLGIAPGSSRLELTVVRICYREVSPYLTHELQPGDQIELRGPVGGHFVLEPRVGGPRLLFSSRGWDDIIYRDELQRLKGNGLTVTHTLTASQPPGWAGYARRVDADMLAEVGPGPAERPRIYVCGPTPFVEAVAEALVHLGHQPQHIRTERFGPTGS